MNNKNKMMQTIRDMESIDGRSYNEQQLYYKELDIVKKIEDQLKKDKLNPATNYKLIYR